MIDRKGTKMPEKSTSEDSSTRKDELSTENSQENDPTPKYGGLRFEPLYPNAPVTSQASGELMYPTAEKDPGMRKSENRSPYKGTTMSSTEDRDPNKMNEEVKVSGFTLMVYSYSGKRFVFLIQKLFQPRN